MDTNAEQSSSAMLEHAGTAETKETKEMVKAPLHNAKNYGRKFTSSILRKRGRRKKPVMVLDEAKTNLMEKRSTGHLKRKRMTFGNEDMFLNNTYEMCHYEGSVRIPAVARDEKTFTAALRNDAESGTVLSSQEGRTPICSQDTVSSKSSQPPRLIAYGNFIGSAEWHGVEHRDNVVLDEQMRTTTEGDLLYKKGPGGREQVYMRLPKNSYNSSSDRQKRDNATNISRGLMYMATGKIVNQWNKVDFDQIITMIDNLRVRFKNKIRQEPRKIITEVDEEGHMPTISNQTGKPWDVCLTPPAQTQRRMSQDMDDAMRAHLMLSWRTYRWMGRLLSYENLRIFWPTNEQEERFSDNPFQRAKYVISKVSYESAAGEPITANFCIIDDVRNAIETYIERTEEWITNEAMPKPDDTFRLKLTVDRGGDVTKVAVCLLNRPTGKVESVFNQLLLAVTDAQDDRIGLRKCMPSIFEQFDNIDVLWIRDKAHIVKRGFAADHKATAAVFGLSGTSSRRPCNMCEVTTEDMHKGMRGEGRTDENAERCLALRSTSTLENNSYVERPLLSFNTTIIGPSPMHSLQEPATYFFTLMQRDMKILATSIHLGIPITAQAFDNSPFHKTSSLTNAKQEKALMNKAKTTIERAPRHPNRPIPSDSSCVWYCVGKSNGSWIQCSSNCKRWYHRPCMGITKDQENEDFSCPVCDQDVSGEKVLERLKNSITFLEVNMRYYEAYESASRHPIVKDLQARAAKANVSLHAFHSGQLSGNHAANFLRRQHEFIDWYLTTKLYVDQTNTVVDKVQCAILTNRGRKYRQVLEPLNVIFCAGKATALSPEQINRLQRAVDKFVVWLPKTFPGYRFKPKIHAIAHHLMDMATTHGSYGLYGEQSIEATHKVFSTLYKQFENHGNKGERLYKAMNLFNNRNLTTYCNPYAHLIHTLKQRVEGDTGHESDSV